MSTRRWLARLDPVVAIAIALPAIPVIVAVIRAIASHWMPIGDQALLPIRARDVFTSHHPLLGTSSSAALNGSDMVPLNHPGPLMFDALAIPERLFGNAGAAIGVGLVNIAAATIAIAFAARRGGRAGAVLCAFAFASLGWAAGSVSLYDPFNPTAAMMPCLASVVLAWALTASDVWALPWLLGVATFAVQLSNSYLLFLVPLVFAAVLVFAVRSHRARDGPWHRPASAAAITLAVLWSQPIVEQLAHGTDGNMARMWRAAGVLSTHPGARLGTQMAAATLALPPWWGRSSFDGIRLFSPVPGLAVAALSLVAVLVAAAVAARWAARKGHADAMAAAAVAGLSVAIAWVAAIRSPMSSFFGIGSDYVRWLWPASVFVWFAAGLTGWRALRPLLVERVPARAAAVAGLVIVSVVCLANLPTHVSLHSQQDLERVRPAVTELVGQAASALHASQVQYHPPEGYDVFGPPLLARLQRQGVDFFVDDPVLLRQFGNGRAVGARRLDDLRVLTGLDALDAQGGATTLGFVSDLTPVEQTELLHLATQIETWLTDGSITLSAKGQHTVDLAFGPTWLEQLDDPALDAHAVSRSGELADVIVADLLSADAAITAALDRYAALRHEVQGTTAAVTLTSATSAG